MHWFIEFFVNCIYELPKTSKGFSLPIKVRTGIPCSLNKVSNLPPAFSPPSFILEGYMPSSVSPEMSFSVIWVLSFPQGPTPTSPHTWCRGFVVKRPTHRAPSPVNSFSAHVLPRVFPGWSVPTCPPSRLMSNTSPPCELHGFPLPLILYGASPVSSFCNDLRPNWRVHSEGTSLLEVSAVQ